jgi:hypothetical protein
LRSALEDLAYVLKRLVRVVTEMGDGAAPAEHQGELDRVLRQLDNL